MSKQKGWIASDYESPRDSGAYTKWEGGDTRIRILSHFVSGYEQWPEDKPVRERYVNKDTPPPAQINPDPKKKVKYFMAFVIWNYRQKRIEICEITQKTLIKKVESLARNPEWGDPRTYDLTVNRVGSTMNDTEYDMVASPKKKAHADIHGALKEIGVIDLGQLFEGDSPFLGVAEEGGHTATSHGRDPGLGHKSDMEVEDAVLADQDLEAGDELPF